MKAPPFDFVKPKTLTEVLDLLVQHGDEARLLAGGQTLLPTLNMRLSEPALLIDIGAIAELKGISVAGNQLRIGALVTHTEIEESPLVARHAPLLALAAPHIAQRAIRNLGTFGGSIAYADPAGEWPACLLALDGVIVARGTSGTRRIAAKDFFLDLYTTALTEGELIEACEIPLTEPADACAFDELARRHGDYAIAGLAVAARRDRNGLQRVRLAFLGIGSTPVLALAPARVLEGQTLTPSLIEESVAALRDELHPLADLTHSSATKRHLACVLARRILTNLAA